MRRSLVMLLSIVILTMPMVTLFASECGDVNNDASLNIFDITHLISYLYRDGSEPECGLAGTVTDIDGNHYLTLKIGDQWWMMENLEVTHYRNGDPIPNVTNAGEWAGLSTGAYCNYDNDTSNVPVYGRLYNWYAVVDSRNIVPEGWHVPSDAEWQTLVDYLGGGTVAGGKMKEVGTVLWVPPNTGATNESFFGGIPGGFCSYLGMFSGIGYQADFWSCTEGDPDLFGWYRELFYYYSEVLRSITNKESGLSIRCVKD